VHTLSKINNNKRLIAIVLALAILCIFLLLIICYYIIEPNKKYITDLENDKKVKVGIVLGAGISKEGKPFDELKARLDIAKRALNQGIVQKLILTGDNRFSSYDEPTAMKKYLENKGISSDKLVLDFAGRSTYESCERASKVFGIKQTILFSAESHLPRAIYLCRHFGIDTYGIGSGLEANNSSRREPIARVKAIFNTFIIGEPTELGDPVILD
jgi:vancomycin permeability regulator SanA